MAGPTKRAIALMGHPDHGGIMRSLGVLHEAAPRFGWELRFVFPRRTQQVAEIGLGDHYRCVPGLNRWRKLEGRLRLPWVLKDLVGEIRRQQASLVYSATLSTFPYGYLAARLCGISSIVHTYSSYGNDEAYRKYWLGRAKHAIAPSRDSLERAGRAVDRFAEVADVVYNGVDAAAIRAAARQGNGEPAEAAAPTASPGMGPGVGPVVGKVVGKVVGMFAYMDRRKNPMALVEMAARIIPEVRDLRILLVGSFPDPAYRAEVVARARALSVESHFEFTGFLVNPFPLLASCDVVVLPTRRDPFPIALLEAMALGKPVVSTRVGGIPEMIVDGKTGYVVSPDDVEGLAERVVELLRDASKRQAIGEAARQRLEENFSLQGFVRRMFSIFESAAGEA